MFASQLELDLELRHYWRYTYVTSARLGEPIPPTPSHHSGSRRSRFVSRALSGVSVCPHAQPPIVPSPAPPSAPEGEGESAS